MSWEIIQGDCLEVMRTMNPGSVHCIITSPPYWALRDYGVDGQFGLETTLQGYIDNMVEVFSEARRILRNDGVLWLNIGDCYSGSPASGGPPSKKLARPQNATPYRPYIRPPNLKKGDLIGIPWNLAFALQSDGWILRRDNIWSKPNPMPESVNGWRWEKCKIKIHTEDRQDRSEPGRLTGSRRHSGNKILDPSTWKDCPGCHKCESNGGYILRKGSGRCTTAHEYIFQLVKTGNYFYDCEAVKEISSGPGKKCGIKNDISRNEGDRCQIIRGDGHNRNLRSVWEIATQPYTEAHFATFPEALVEPCIKAGTSEKGCCPLCGAPWARILEPSEEAKKRLGEAWHDHINDLGRGQRGVPPALEGPANITKGWRPTCNCKTEDFVPCTVMDMFAGSGTTGAVAVKLGRNFIGCELNQNYISLANKRILDAAEKAGKITAEMAKNNNGKPLQLGPLERGNDD